MPSAIKRLEEVEVTDVYDSPVGTYNASFENEKFLIYGKDIKIKEGYHVRRKSGGPIYLIFNEPSFKGDAPDPHYEVEVRSVVRFS